VINAALCGHEDVKAETIEAVLTEAADGISAARPGARRDVLESYIKRLAKLEEIALSYKGVEMCYAIQAGRELRVITKAEIKADVKLAKRMGLLHDIGKALTHEQEGSHPELSLQVLTKWGESSQVINAALCGHENVEPETIEAVLTEAADGISAARPGARRDVLESYIKRLAKLEEIAMSYKGVEMCYAIQAGRELRIMTKSEQISDLDAHQLAKDISKRIEAEMQYPGHIKVIVIRETRAVEVAK